MFEMIRKSLLAGLGIAVVTKEKVLEATRNLVEEGKLTRREAEDLAAELVEEGKQQWQEMQDKVDEMIRRGFETLDISSKEEFLELQKRVTNIEKRLTIFEDRLPPVKPEGESGEQ